MNETRSDQARAQIHARLAELDAEDVLGQDSQSVVELDQQSVGRLSRMDALQAQAMARATQARRDQERRALQAALLRLQEGEFGYCEDCGDDIEAARLARNPTVRLCMSCARG